MKPHEITQAVDRFFRENPDAAAAILALPNQKEIKIRRTTWETNWNAVEQRDRKRLLITQAIIIQMRDQQPSVAAAPLPPEELRGTKFFLPRKNTRTSMVRCGGFHGCPACGGSDYWKSEFPKHTGWTHWCGECGYRITGDAATDAAMLEHKKSVNPPQPTQKQKLAAVDKLRAIAIARGLDLSKL